MVEGGTARERKLADQKHAAGVFVLRGQFRHQHQRGDVVRLVAVVGHHRPGEIAGFDRVEKLGRANDVGLGRLGAVRAGQRREGVERELTEARLGARDLAVIGGRIARRLLVVASRLLGPVQRFRGAAAPVGAARQRDRVLVAFGNLQEVRIGGRGIVQVAQRDPSGHELLLGAVVRAVGRRGVRPPRGRRSARRPHRAACGKARAAPSTTRRGRGCRSSCLGMVLISATASVSWSARRSIWMRANL